MHHREKAHRDLDRVLRAEVLENVLADGQRTRAEHIELHALRRLRARDPCCYRHQ
jgi:hypothetical protein